MVYGSTGVRARKFRAFGTALRFRAFACATSSASSCMRPRQRAGCANVSRSAPLEHARRPQIVRMDARGRDGDVHVGEDGVQPAEDRGAVLVFIQRSRGKCDERSEEADAQLHDVGLSPGAALKYVRAGVPEGTPRGPHRT